MMITIKYDNKVVALISGGNTAILPVADKTMKTDVVIIVPSTEGGADSAIPIEISTEDEMTALLTTGEVGGVYKYIGVTGTYENGALYLLEPTNTFTFIVSGETYTADNGMNWYEWAHSNYCNETSSCESEESRVYIRTKMLILDRDGKAVIGRDVITRGGIYLSINEDDYVEPNTFTINAVEYTMESRMTWYDWTRSEYNIHGFSCPSANSYVYEADTTNTVTDEDGNEVIGTNYISEGGKYLIKKAYFTFTIVGDNTYTVENGTTWSEWVNGAAPDKFYIESGTGYVYISHPTKAYILNSNGNRVKGSDLITEGTYTIAEPGEITTFTFAIDGTSYTAEEGMTWGQWCESAYNSNGFWASDNGNIFSSSDGKVLLDGEEIYDNMAIVPNAAYSTQ